MNVIPFVKVARSAPWFSREHSQYRYNTANDGNRLNQIPTFRVINVPPASNGWITLFPFLFTAFTSQLQWLTFRPESASTGIMVGALLTIQNVINGKYMYLQNPTNVVKGIIGLTYGITGVYITTVALMSFINAYAKSNETSFLVLVRYQDLIFSFLRMFGILLTFLFIPLLVFHSDPTTGFQQELDWLYYLVGCSCLGFYVAFVTIKCWKRYQKDKINKESAEETYTEEINDIVTKPMALWSIGDVAMWIEHGLELKSQSKLTNVQLQIIAEKMDAAMIDGEILLKVYSDESRLVDSVQLPLGLAMHFASAMEKIKASGSLTYACPTEQVSEQPGAKITSLHSSRSVAVDDGKSGFMTSSGDTFD